MANATNTLVGRSVGHEWAVSVATSGHFCWPPTGSSYWPLTTGNRRFHPDAVEAVRRIRLFLDAGLPLTVVSQVMPCFVHDGARLHACVADYLHDHMDTVRERIEALDEQRDTIERLQRLVVA